MRLLQALQDLTRNAKRRFLRVDVTYIESFLCIEFIELRTQTPAAHRDFTNAAPCAVTFHEYFMNGILRRFQSFKGHSAGLGISNFDLARFKQLDSHQNSLHNVERLKASHHHRDLELLQQRRIFVIPHHCIDVPRK